MMAVAGPERSGSGIGVPVPRSTTFVRVDEVVVGPCGEAFCAWTEFAKNNAEQSTSTIQPTCFMSGHDKQEIGPLQPIPRCRMTDSRRHQTTSKGLVFQSGIGFGRTNRSHDLGGIPKGDLHY